MFLDPGLSPPAFTPPRAGILLSELKPALPVPECAPEWVKGLASRLAEAGGEAGKGGGAGGEGREGGRELVGLLGAGASRGDDDDDEGGDQTAGLLGGAR